MAEEWWHRGQLDRQDTQTDTDLPDGVTFVSADRGQEKQHLPAVRHTALTAAMQLARLTARGAGTGTCGWPLDWLDWHPQGCLPQSVKWRHSNPSRSSNFSLRSEVKYVKPNKSRGHWISRKRGKVSSNVSKTERSSQSVKWLGFGDGTDNFPALQLRGTLQYTTLKTKQI
jgi:hypothetical protein